MTEPRPIYTARMHIVVLGTGIVGTCTAAWLQRDGHRITFVIAGAAGRGLLVRQRRFALAQRLPAGGHAGHVEAGARLAARSRRAAGDPPSYLPAVAPWLLRFLRHSTPRRGGAHRHRAARPAGADLRVLRRRCSHTPAPQHLVRRSGCLYVYGSPQSAARWQWGMDLRRSSAWSCATWARSELAQLEPDLRGRFRFGILAPDNGSTLNPDGAGQGPARAVPGRRGADAAGRAPCGFERRGDTVTAVRLASGQRGRLRRRGGGRRRLVAAAGARSWTRACRWRRSAAITSPCRAPTCSCATP